MLNFLPSVHFVNGVDVLIDEVIFSIIIFGELLIAIAINIFVITKSSII